MAALMICQKCDNKEFWKDVDLMAQGIYYLIGGRGAMECSPPCENSECEGYHSFTKHLVWWFPDGYILIRE